MSSLRSLLADVFFTPLPDLEDLDAAAFDLEADGFDFEHAIEQLMSRTHAQVH